jgi:hypothetical protein
VNRPIALVRDTFTTPGPFDVAVINVHQYDARLAAWELEEQREALRAHIGSVFVRSNGTNASWTYFGLTRRAEPAEVVAQCRLRR